MLRGYLANRHADNCTTQVLMDIDGREEKKRLLGMKRGKKVFLVQEGKGGAAIRSTALRKKEGGSGAGLGSGA